MTDNYNASKFSETLTYFETRKKIHKILKNKIPRETDRINLLYQIVTNEIQTLIQREEVDKAWLEATKTLLQTYTYTLLTMINGDIDKAITFHNKAKQQLSEKYTGKVFASGQQKTI